MVSSPECNWSFAEVLLGALAHTTPDTVEAGSLESGVWRALCLRTYQDCLLRGSSEVLCHAASSEGMLCVAVATCKLRLDLACFACFRQECGSSINPSRFLNGV